MIPLNIPEQVIPKDNLLLSDINVDAIHDILTCETCILIQEIEKDRMNLFRQEGTDKIDDPFPLVCHCTSFFCERPTFDGDHWCSSCVNLWHIVFDLGDRTK